MMWYPVKLLFFDPVLKKYLLLIVWLSCPLCFLAQETEPGNWLMYFGLNKLNDTWSIHTEAQYRNHTAYPGNIEQLLLRTGVNYHIDKNAFVTLGYGHITSHVYESEQKAPESTEHRIWQQLIMKNKVGKFGFEHRYRIEQRWVNDDYRNRLRYRIMATMPFSGNTIEPGDFFLGLYDEIFMNTEETFFDRNRLYGAIGYQVKSNLGLQVGMLNQRVNAFGKWYLQFAILLNTDLSKQSD